MQAIGGGQLLALRRERVFRAMRLFVRAFVLVLTMGPVACANVPPAQEEPSSVVTVGCTNNLAGPLLVSLLDWELVVSTDEPIESGKAFIATLEGVASV